MKPKTNSALLNSRGRLHPIFAINSPLLSQEGASWLERRDWLKKIQEEILSESVHLFSYFQILDFQNQARRKSY